MAIRNSKPKPKSNKPPTDIIRRDRFGRFNPNGKYYATKAGILRKLPAYRDPAPIIGRRYPKPPTPPTPATPRLAEPPPPPPPERTTASGRKGAVISTWFKAAGSMEEDRSISFGDSYKRGLLDEDVENYDEGYAVPALFYSNQGHLLGRVKFAGEIPLIDLIQLLNDKLQYLGEEAPEFDFRKAYSRWEYKYQIIETIGPTSTVLYTKQDRR